MSVLESKDKSKDIITSIFDKDVSTIILGYHFLISNEFKLELGDAMNDRSDRKLQYFNFSKGSQNFITRSILYNKIFIMDFFTKHIRDSESREIDIGYRIIHQRTKRLQTFCKNNLPPVLSKKSFNRLTSEEFLSIK